jgi:hypothetical protein
MFWSISVYYESLVKTNDNLSVQSISRQMFKSSTFRINLYSVTARPICSTPLRSKFKRYVHGLIEFGKSEKKLLEEKNLEIGLCQIEDAVSISSI